MVAALGFGFFPAVSDGRASRVEEQAPGGPDRRPADRAVRDCRAPAPRRLPPMGITSTPLVRHVHSFSILRRPAARVWWECVCIRVCRWCRGADQIGVEQLFELFTAGGELRWREMVRSGGGGFDHSGSHKAALEATQGQMDGFVSQLPYKCHQNRVASVGD